MKIELSEADEIALKDDVWLYGQCFIEVRPGGKGIRRSPLDVSIRMPTKPPVAKP